MDISLLKKTLFESQYPVLITSKVRRAAVSLIKDLLQDKYCPFSFDNHCGKCATCNKLSKLDKGVHSDVFFVSKEVGIADIRKIQDFTMSMPLELDRKFVIISADKISSEAQNALLKLTEDTQEILTVVFIIGSESQVLDTIKSRFIQFNLKFDKSEFDKICDELQFKEKNMIGYITNYSSSQLVKLKELRDSFKQDYDQMEEFSSMFIALPLSPDFFALLKKYEQYRAIYAFRAVLSKLEQTLIPEAADIFSKVKLTNKTIKQMLPKFLLLKELVSDTLFYRKFYKA